MTSTTRAFSHTGIAFGCDYNPEQWDRNTWAEDMLLMQEAGVDLVAINIFGWSNLEPRPGEYHFDDLDTIINMLHEHGIKVNLGTATSSPPPWLSSQHPEIQPVTADGTQRYQGGRQHWCPSSPIFRTHALQLVTQVADRYGNHPAVALWHVSNELGCHNAHCYCDITAAAFRTWLQEKYGTLEALNTAWGTTFWSQRYGAWEHINTPKLTLSTGNPGQALDFRRFSSDTLLEHYRAERDIITARSNVPVTTNFMVTDHITGLDYWRWAPEMDIIANDHYLDHRLEDPTAELAFAADLTRGLARGGPWLLMEQATSAVNWQPLNKAKAPGEMLRNSLSHVARGAESVCFFQWRASLQGSEKFHSALVPHAGTNTDHWRSILEHSRILDTLDEVQGTRVIADAALLFSWESNWAAEGVNRPSQHVRPLRQAHAAYEAARTLGITVDVIGPDSDLSGYPLIIIPGLHLVTATQQAAISAATAAGAQVVVTYNSGIVDEDDRVYAGGYPGAFRTLLGITSEAFLPQDPDETLTLSWDPKGAPWAASAETAQTPPTGTLWAEHLHLAGAQAVAHYQSGPQIGMPAITRNAFGAGHAWYVATELAQPHLSAIFRHILHEQGNPAPNVSTRFGSAGVEMVRRASTNRSYLFVINHGHDDATVTAHGHELITAQPVTGSITVPGGNVRVIREDHE